MTSPQHDAERQKLLLNALQKIAPRELTSGQLKDETLVPKAQAKKLLAGHPNICIREHGGKSHYSYSESTNT